MNQRLVGLVVVAVGVALAVISALANPLGIGVHGFGWKQVAGIVVGVAVAIAGAVLAARRPAEPAQRP
jgi:predicted Kef-type K+ transport protein